jgi:hypothetical protein
MNEKPQKRNAFLHWLNTAAADVETILKSASPNQLTETLKKSFANDAAQKSTLPWLANRNRTDRTYCATSPEHRWPHRSCATPQVAGGGPLQSQRCWVSSPQASRQTHRRACATENSEEHAPQVRSDNQRATAVRGPVASCEHRGGSATRESTSRGILPLRYRKDTLGTHSVLRCALGGSIYR